MEFETKSELRQYCITLRKKAKSFKMGKFPEVFLHSSLQNIALYKATDQEISLDPLFHMLSKFNLFLPRVVSQTEMEFCPYKKGDELKKNNFGIEEPVNEAYQGEFDLIFVPALALDKLGNRLGYGAGYYDRFLQKNPQSLTIGVCLEECFFNEIIYEDHDVKIDYVFTNLSLWSVKDQRFLKLPK